MPWLLDPNPARPEDLTDMPKVSEPEKVNPTTGEIFGASFRQSNIIASTAQAMPLASARSGEDEPDLDPFEYAKGTPAELMPSFLARARNRREIDAYNDLRKQEAADRRTREASGWMGFLADLVANGTDPTILIPAGNLARTGKIGYNVLRSAAVLGGSAAGSTAIQEAVLQGTQETRPIEQSALAVGGAALIGGLLGTAGAKLLDNVAYNKLAERLAADASKVGELPQDAAEREMRDLVNTTLARPASAGAAAVDRLGLDDMSIAGGAAKSAAMLTASLNPIMRALHSPSAVEREFMLGLLDNPIYLKMNKEKVVTGLDAAGNAASVTVGPQAMAPAVENMMKEAHGAYTIALEETEKAFIASKAAKAGIPSDEFRRRVGRAMRRRDIDEFNDPHVTAAAKVWRDRVWNPLLKKAQDTGLLPANVSIDTARSYFTRMYDVPLIEANEQEFKAIVRDGLEEELSQEVARLDRAAARRSEGLRREAEDLEFGILRRSTSDQARTAGDEVVADAATEKAILDALKLVRAGTKKEEPEGLTAFLARNGGLFDPGKELESLGISAKTRPGFVKSTRRAAQNPKGGLDLDDAALKAWEEGFFEGAERPSIREFLDALSDDFGKSRRVVRAADREAAAEADMVSRITSDLERMGVDVKSKAPMFSTSEDLKGLVGRITKAMDADATARAAKLKAAAEEALQEAARLPRRGGDRLAEEEFKTYIEEIANDVFNKITGRANDGLTTPFGQFAITKRGPLKERTLRIPDLYVDKSGRQFEKFLRDDVEEVGQRYTRVMSADAELARKFDGVTFEEKIKAIQDDYAALRERVAGNPADVARLNAAEKSAITDAKAVVEMLRGQYLAEQHSTNFAKALLIAKAFNGMRAMGGVVLASATDAARPMMIHGLGRYMNDGVANLATNVAGYKLSIREAKIAGAVGDVINQARMATLAEITDPYSIASPFEKFINNMSRGFWRLTGMPYWNDFWKGFSSVITQNRLLETAADLAKASHWDREWLAYLNIDDRMAARISNQFATHGEQIRGVRVANTEAWTDTAAAQAYRSAIAKDVDSIIVAKGVGDIPLVLRTPLGSAVSQFRGFALASYNRATLRGLQEEPLSVIAGMIMSTTIGMFISWLKAVESNRMQDISNNPGRWIAEGLDRSGMLAIPFEINNTFEKIGGPGVYTGMQALFPDAMQRAPASRYASRNAVDAMMGPTFGLLYDVQQLTTAGIKGDLTPGDINAIRRLTPGATLPFLRSLVEYEVKPALQEAVR